MIKLIVLLLAISGCSITPYAKIGTGYKFQEQNMTWTNHRTGVQNKADDPVSARFEVGARTGNWTYGISHHSQWFTGEPFNNGGEYYKTEWFVDYEYKFKTIKFK